MEKKLAHSDTLTKKGTIVNQEQENSPKNKREVISKTKRPKKSSFSARFKKAINSHKMQGLALVVVALFMVSTISLIFPSEGGVDVLTYTQEGNAGDDDEIYDAMQERNPGEVYKFDPYPDYNVMGIPLGDSHELQIDFQAVNLGTEDIFLQVWNYTAGDWNTKVTFDNYSSTPLAYSLTSDEISSGVCSIRFVDSDQTFGDTLQSTLGIDYVRVYTTGAGSSTGDDYVDDDTRLIIGGGVDKGSHSNFDNQKAYDSAYDELTEAGGGVVYPIEDYVDNKDSNMDSVSDLGDLTDFDNMTAYDGSYANLSEATISYEIEKLGLDTSATGTTSPLQFSHTLVTGSNRKVVIYVGWENNGNLVVSTITYGGQTCTEAIAAATGTFGIIYGCAIWYIDEGNLPSEGSNQVSITMSGTPSSCQINALCAEYGGVTSGAPDDSDETGESSPSDDTIENTGLSASETDLVCSVVGSGNVGSFTHGQSQNELLDFQDSSSTFACTDLICTGSITQVDSTYSSGANRMARAACHWSAVSGSAGYQMDQEVQFTGVIHFLTSETLCIYAGSFGGSENINVTYWTGSAWSSIAPDLTPNAWNNFSVSLTSETFTIKFGGSDTSSSDTDFDYWLIDAVLLRVSGAGSNEDAVDNDTSNVGSPSDLGILSNFANMKAKNGMATLTEESAGDITDEWGITSSSFTGSFSPANYRYMGGTSPDIEGMTVTALWIRMASVSGTVAIALYTGGTLSDPTGASKLTENYDVSVSGTGWKRIDVPDYSWSANTVTWIGFAMSGSIYTSASSSDAGDFQTARGRWSQTYPTNANESASMPSSPGAGSFSNHWYTVHAEYTYPGYYQLDQEVQWTNFPYQMPNIQLCIYAGTFTGTAENIRVDIWNGTAWVNVFSSLTSNAWNNVSISSYADSSNITIRFVDQEQASDSDLNSWDIDVALIYVWQEADEPFELDLEIRWTDVDTSESYYNLSIYCGTFNTTEALEVWIWDGFGWQLINSSLTPSSWNNFTITSYIFSPNVIIRFLGADVQSDGECSGWNIDASIIFGWTPGITEYDYTTEGDAISDNGGPDVFGGGYDVFNETGTGTIPTALNTPSTTLTREPGIEATFEVTFIDTHHDVNITNANVTYEWDNGTGPFVYDANEVGNGVYNFTINTTSLDVGTYDINVTASKEQYDNQSRLLTLEIVPISTILTVDKVALIKEHGETAVFNLTFRADNQGFEITGANLTYVWDYGSDSLTEVGDGVYRLTILTGSLDEEGTYYIDVNASLENYESQLLQLTLEIVPISTTLIADKAGLTKEHGQTAVFNVTFSAEKQGYGITGANLTYVWDYGSGQLVEVGDGVYRLTILESIIDSLDKGTYYIDVTASLKHYESQSLQLSLVIEVPSEGGGDGGVSNTAFIGLAAAVGGSLAAFFLLSGRTSVSPAVKAINKNIDQLENGKTPPQRPISTREEKVSSILDERFKLLDEI